MDEILFENRFYKDKEMLSEFFWKNSAVTSLWARIFIYAASGYALYSLIWGGAAGSDRIWKIVLLAVAVFSQFTPLINASLNIARTKAMNGGAVPEHVVTFGDDIVVQEGEQTLTVEYTRIVKAVRLKRSYALMIDSRSGILIRPDGFTVGTFAEFKDFLRKIRPGIQVQD